MCGEAPCPSSGSFMRDITVPPSSCQELIIESPGYPNGYLDNQCNWGFSIMGNFRINLVVTFLDFDGEVGHHLLIEGTRGANKVSIFNDDANGVPNSGHEKDYVDSFTVQFMPSATRFNKRGSRIRIMFSIQGVC